MAAEKAYVTLTPPAVRQISRLMEQSGSYGLRIDLKKGGCAGMEYTMEYVSQADSTDDVVDQDGVRILIAPQALFHIIGTVIDYETSLLESKFTFRNPNVTDACGCGESVRFELPGN